MQRIQRKIEERGRKIFFLYLFCLSYLTQDLNSGFMPCKPIRYDTDKHTIMVNRHTKHLKENTIKKKKKVGERL